MFKLKAIIFYSFFSITLLSCSDPSDKKDTTNSLQISHKSSKIQVAVVNYPLQYFAEQIGRNDVNVYFPVKEGDPAYWKPDRKEIQVYQKADIIFLNGANYAKWISYVSLPEDKLIDTSQSFSNNYISIQNEVKHNHGPKGDHSHGTIAFTTWLDMQHAIQQADKIREILIKHKPAQKDRYNKNYEELTGKLKAIDEQFRIIEHNLMDTPVIFSHPVYQYFQRKYSINGISVHWEPDVMPDKQSINTLIDENNSHQSKWIIWENEPLPEISENLKSFGIQSAVFNPTSTKPEQGDFISAMHENVSQLKHIINNNH